jgi:hypothetical protein
MAAFLGLLQKNSGPQVEMFSILRGVAESMLEPAQTQTRIECEHGQTRSKGPFNQSAHDKPNARPILRPWQLQTGLCRQASSAQPSLDCALCRCRAPWHRRSLKLTFSAQVGFKFREHTQHVEEALARRRRGVDGCSAAFSDAPRAVTSLAMSSLFLRALRHRLGSYHSSES